MGIYGAMAHKDVRSGLSRRGFLTGAAALGAGLVTAGCAGTYDVGSGITGSSGGDNQSTLVYWNLLTGGDGTHMVAMEDAYRKAHPNIDLQSTILQWGAPYYTKLSLAIRSGSPPDVAIMHLSRINQYGPPGMLTPISLDLLAAHGMEPKDFTPLAFSKAHYNGQLLCIPLDTHPFVQYYNTKVCKKAGLLDSSGTLPPIKSPDAMLDALRKLKKTGATPVVCDTINDPATPWRLFYSLYSQAGGQVLADNGKDIVLDQTLATKVLTFIHQLASEGLMNANVDAGGGTAVFQAGDAGLYLGGRVERHRLPGGQDGVQHAAVPGPVRQGRGPGRLAHVHLAQADLGRPGEDVDRPDHDQDPARAEPDLGRRRPHPGLAAGAGLFRLQETQAPVQLRRGGQLRRLRPARLVQRLRLGHGELPG